MDCCEIFTQLPQSQVISAVAMDYMTTFFSLQLWMKTNEKKTFLDISEPKLTFSIMPSWRPFWNFLQTSIAQPMHEVDLQFWRLLMFSWAMNYFGRHLGRHFFILFKRE